MDLLGTVGCDADLEKKLSEFSTNGNTASLVIDMQPQFLQKIEDNERENLIRSQLMMLDLFVQRDIPTIVLEYLHFGVDRTNQEIRERVEKIPRHSYVTKTNDDGFKNPELAHQLKLLNVKFLLLMGINASYCVKKTAKSALSKGYVIFTARQLIANQSHTQTLFHDDILWYEKNGVYFPDVQNMYGLL